MTVIKFQPKPNIHWTELCMDCMKEKAEFFCDMPSDTPMVMHVYVDGHRKLDVTDTCDRQICKKCAIEIVKNRHCCKRCAERISIKIRQHSERIVQK